MEDFFPFLQNAADTDFHFGAHLPPAAREGYDGRSKFATTVRTEQRVY